MSMHPLQLQFLETGAGTVVPCLTTMVSCFGEGDEKGKVMGIFRSLGALARALGPFAACAGTTHTTLLL